MSKIAASDPSAAHGSNFKGTLGKHPSIAPPVGPLVLLVLDGVGIGSGDQFDAVAMAKTPHLDSLRQEALFRPLRAHGEAVGMPSDADMGNSEVGHNTMGSGRINPQGAKLVETAINSGTIWQGTWVELISHLHQTHGALHLIGLLSDGNVHSHERHLHAIIRHACAAGIKRLYVHVLLDGRDVGPQSALIYLDRLEQLLQSMREGGMEYYIGSGAGRMVATMDRYEADWGMVKRGWDAHVLGIGRCFQDARSAVETYRNDQPDISDQFLAPFVICKPDGTARGRMQDGDGVLVFNFRGDRVIEISQAFEADGSFDKFDRGSVPLLFFSGILLYDGDRAIPKKYLIAPPPIEHTVSELLARQQVRQFACAETQKFGHVTYFWNGNRSGKFDAQYEDYLEIPSDLVPFEQRPAMKSKETADAIIEAIEHGGYRFIRANFAAGDMVGHTGNIAAAVAAMEAIDVQLGRIIPVVQAQSGTLLVTADHGNAEEMVERDKQGAALAGPDGQPLLRTSHSLNPVPFLLLDKARSLHFRDDLPAAGLANVAATVLELLGYQAPETYEPSLLDVR